jgi:trans-aconitate methyltransferase
MTLGPEYFDDLYRRHRDPWGFRTRWYEARKRHLTMAALPDQRYASVFEPGCSIGLLTQLLAARSDRVLALDVSAAALQQARVSLPVHVQLRQGAVPHDWPTGHFDLVVLSELGYYLEKASCQQMAEMAAATARDLVAVHWRHPVDDYPLTGDDVHQVIHQAAIEHGLAQVCSHVEADFHLAVWSHDHRSVGSRTGLVPP